MPIEVIQRARISRRLPQSDVDGSRDGEPIRGSRYGEQYVQGLIHKQHGLADEGSYFTTNNAQTAITGPAAIAFAATTPLLIIQNRDSVNDPAAKRIYLDYIHILAGATAMSNGTSNTATFWGAVLDNTLRYSSGGTNLTSALVNTNIDVSDRASISSVYFGAPTATAASASARTIVGQRLFREPVSATALSLVNIEDYHFTFGTVEAPPAQATGSSAVLQANAVHKVFNLPPVVIGPNQSFLLYLWLIVNSAPVAGTFLPEVGLWER